MCKVAAEVVFEDLCDGRRESTVSSPPIVRIADVQKASRDMFYNMINRAVSCSSDYEALLFISMGSLKRAPGRIDGFFTVSEILTKMESIANASGDKRYASSQLAFADVLDMLNRLSDVRTFARTRISFSALATFFKCPINDKSDSLPPHLLYISLGKNHLTEYTQKR